MEHELAVTVRIPAPLQDLTGGQSRVECEGGTVAEVLAHLDGGHPGTRDRICDETGKVRRFVNIYVNEDDVRFLQGEATPVNDGDEISIIPALAGG
jgi:molybdopterin synthase sulfur carrier subunit